jgi:hypothetical protein
MAFVPRGHLRRELRPSGRKLFDNVVYERSLRAAGVLLATLWDMRCLKALEAEVARREDSSLEVIVTSSVGKRYIEHQW